MVGPPGPKGIFNMQKINKKYKLKQFQFEIHKKNLEIKLNLLYF